MAFTPSDSVATQRIKTKERHDLLRQEAQEIIQSHPDDQWMPLLRSAAGELELDLDVKDAELQKLLDDAERSLNPSKVYRRGEQQQASEPTFLLDGLTSKPRETNLIVGQPTVGKSSFMVGFAAALRDRREKYLGRESRFPMSGCRCCCLVLTRALVTGCTFCGVKASLMNHRPLTWISSATSTPATITIH